VHPVPGGKEELKMIKPSHHLLCIFLLGTRGVFLNYHAKQQKEI
jgi:hypothetical protein